MTSITFPEPWEVLMSEMGGSDIPCSGKVIHQSHPRFACEFFVGEERPELAIGLSSFDVLTGVHLFNVTLLDQDRPGSVGELQTLNAKMRELSRLVHAVLGAPDEDQIYS